MSTIIKDKDGNVLQEIPGTKYHPDGTGPRDATGKPIRSEHADPVAPSADSTAAQTELGQKKGK